MAWRGNVAKHESNRSGIIMAKKMLASIIETWRRVTRRVTAEKASSASK